jgi:CelD/BcsL family acetyltransferase involved in cellulose biosynthesis
LREQGEVRGVLPCFLLTWEGRRQLTLLGSGITDYLDPLIAPGWEEPFVSLIEQHLAESKNWEVVDWTDLDPRHPLFSMQGLGKRPGMPCNEIIFEPPFEAFWSHRGKELRRNLRRYRDRAEKLAPIRVERHDSASEDLVATLVRLHTKRWEVQGEPGMIEANGSEVFLRAVAAEMSALGLARFFTLRFGDEIAALIFALDFRNKIYAYMSAFDPAHSPLGLGRTLLYEALRMSFESHRAWDFLRGDEAYKTEWGATTHPRARLRLERLPGA